MTAMLRCMSTVLSLQYLRVSVTLLRTDAPPSTETPTTNTMTPLLHHAYHGNNVGTDDDTIGSTVVNGAAGYSGSHKGDSNIDVNIDGIATQLNHADDNVSFTGGAKYDLLSSTLGIDLSLFRDSPSGSLLAPAGIGIKIYVNTELVKVSDHLGYRITDSNLRRTVESTRNDSGPGPGSGNQRSVREHTSRITYRSGKLTPSRQLTVVSCAK